MNFQMPSIGGRDSGDPFCSCPVGSVLQGAWRFAVVSIVGFGVWAFAGRWFRTHGGEAGLYAASTVVFVGLAGLLMHPLVRGPRRLLRFYGAFIRAFIAYGMNMVKTEGTRKKMADLLEETKDSYSELTSRANNGHRSLHQLVTSV